MNQEKFDILKTFLAEISSISEEMTNIVNKFKTDNGLRLDINLNSAVFIKNNLIDPEDSREESWSLKESIQKIEDPFRKILNQKFEELLDFCMNKFDPPAKINKEIKMKLRELYQSDNSNIHIQIMKNEFESDSIIIFAFIRNAIRASQWSPSKSNSENWGKFAEHYQDYALCAS